MNGKICTCGCHDPARMIKHILPCCDICQWCGQRISWTYYLEHRENCVCKPKPRRFAYSEPHPIVDESGVEIGTYDQRIEMTEEEILKSYYPYWSKRVMEVHPDKLELLTTENCLNDWIVINWAEEVKD